MDEEWILTNVPIVPPSGQREEYKFFTSKTKNNKFGGQMVGWHHQLKGYEFEQTLGDSEGQGSLVCCSAWSLKEPDPT